MGVSLAPKGMLALGETKETPASQVRALLGVGAAGRPGGWAHSMQPCLFGTY